MLPRSLALALSLAMLVAASQARAAGAVDTVAQEAAQGLGPTPAAVVVVAAPLVSDAPAPRGEELSIRIAALVAGRLGAGAHAHAQSAPLASARALAGRASALVFVQGEIARGDLRATIDVYPSMANGWDRIRNPLPAPTGHAFATAKIDAEVRAYLAPLSLEQASVHRAKHDEGDVLAAACGDLDGDGGDEIVLVSKARVALGRLHAGRFVPERTAAWGALAPRAAVPMREALASAAIGAGAIHVGTTDRAGLSLTPDFTGHAPLGGLPAWTSEGLACLVPDPSAGAFDGAPIDCAPAKVPRPKVAVPSPRFDAFAYADVIDVGGVSHPVTAVREPSGKIKLRSPDRVGAPDGEFGAALAVGDLDEDGVPDVATTVAGPDDAVNVFSWPPGATDLHGRLHLAAPGGVRALAVCPSEQGGAPALVAVVGSEIWVVRAGHAGDGEAGHKPGGLGPPAP